MADDLEDMRLGQHTVRENLAHATASGKLTALPDGGFALPPGPSDPYLQVRSGGLGCRFLNAFLFQHAYDRAAVPYGCRSCYKVKAAPPDLRGLVALRGILEEAPYISKCGVDLINPHSRDVYAGYLYLNGLEAARAAWRDLRRRVDAHLDLGTGVPLVIKRGCSNYEAACGPSDRWTFPNGLAELEERLKARVPAPPPPIDYRRRRMMTMVRWLQVAYSLRDDTYLAYTGGKPLHRPTLCYPVEEPEPEPAPVS